MRFTFIPSTTTKQDLTSVLLSGKCKLSRDSFISVRRRWVLKVTMMIFVIPLPRMSCTCATILFPLHLGSTVRSHERTAVLSQPHHTGNGVRFGRIGRWHDGRLRYQRSRHGGTKAADAVGFCNGRRIKCLRMSIVWDTAGWAFKEPAF